MPDRTARRVKPPVTPAGNHAIVIGASMAGLLAARVLVDRFERVTIVERDHLPEGAEQRAGVPQGRHTHILLARGLHILEQLFPGLEAELAAAGAPAVDSGADWAALLPAGWAPRYRSGIVLRACSRPLLEATVRRRVKATPGIHILAQHDAIGLLADADRRSVVGIRVRDRERVADDAGAEAMLPADLVVDATGRESHAPQWLEMLGYPVPAETVINAFIGYASRRYRRPTGGQPPWKAMLLSAHAPDQPRMGVIYPIEGDCWQVGLAGSARDYPPTDEEGWLAFAHSLRSPRLYEAIQGLDPITPISGYRRTQNRLRHFERLSRWPSGFVVVGDAVCAFNPVYGQGMTVAALGAMVLDRWLRTWRAGTMPDGSLRFQRELARVNAVPWLLATSEDFRWPTTEGSQRGHATRLLHRYLDQVLSLATRSAHVHRAYTEVAYLLRPPRRLVMPDILVPVAGQMLTLAWQQLRRSVSIHRDVPAVARLLTRWSRSVRGRR
jgi:2-polyprenyl-6-methoxyphenol hydroxylase-like FAD-dependent oxidoreductase